MTAREDILARVRAALGSSVPHPPDIPRDYRTRGDEPPGSAALLDLLTDRLVDYRAAVRRTTAADLPATIATVLGSRNATRVVVPSDLPDGWVANAGWMADAVIDDGALTAEELDRTDAVVTGCSAAIAETGTVILDAGPEQGRRIITLIPDLHICVVRAAQVVQTVPEALARLDPTRPLTFVSGPSATSDIELDRVEGVHGPRTLIVIVVG